MDFLKRFNEKDKNIAGVLLIKPPYYSVKIEKITIETDYNINYNKLIETFH